MAHYVDGFVISVPENKIDDYCRIAQKAVEESQWEKHSTTAHWQFGK